MTEHAADKDRRTDAAATMKRAEELLAELADVVANYSQYMREAISDD